MAITANWDTNAAWRKALTAVPDPNIPRGQFYMFAEKPATIGTEMEPMDPLDRKLAELSTRIARLERQHVQGDAATAEGKRLLGSLLVLIGRRLRNEDAKHN